MAVPVVLTLLHGFLSPELYNSKHVIWGLSVSICCLPFEVGSLVNFATIRER
jgi:hypothetical protein